MARDALVITGPTATGKTAVAIALARHLDIEIISMDSRQVYRRMDIGTAKPSTVERAGVPHHGFDVVEPGERFNAGRFAALARGWIREIRRRGRVPVLVGGTGFFLRALTHPMFTEPDLDPRRKESWKQFLATLDDDAIRRWAAQLDPATAGRTGDRQRLARAVEIAVLTGRPLGWWHAHAEPAVPAIDPAIFVLDLPRDLLVKRIDERVDEMARSGLVEEVRGLVDAGLDEGAPGMDATGYIELVPHVRGERVLEQALEMIRIATRQYARRQRTWLRHQLPPGAYWLDARRTRDELAAEIARTWTESA